MGYGARLARGLAGPVSSCVFSPAPHSHSYGSGVSWLARTEAFCVDFIHDKLAKPGGRKSVSAIDSGKTDPTSLKTHKACRVSEHRPQPRGMWLGWKRRVLASACSGGLALPWILTRHPFLSETVEQAQSNRRLSFN